ncbi:MAG: CHAD domain-containing protein [Acidobacteria bacterium]|nr:CHAD domain-containing protein [Acidobacteriota bacterium]
MPDLIQDRLSARLRQVQLEAAAASLTPDEDAVHRLRAAVRRLMEPLRAVRAGKAVRRRLRPVMRAAGETRNLDVAISLCGKSGVAGAEGVVAALRRERSRAAQRLIRRLIELDADSLTLRAATVDGAAALLCRLSARYWAAGAKAADGGARELHAFRLKTKHLRYTLELCLPKATAYLALLRAVQQQLGDLNDCETMRGRSAVRQSAELKEWLSERQHKARDRFDEVWAEAWKRTRGGRTWDRYFAARVSPDVVPAGRVLLQ